MLVTKEIEIDMGHRVPNHKSKCRNFHGHRYKIEVGVNDKIITTPGQSDEGMVIDFGDLKEIMMQEIDKKYDHGFVMWAGDTYYNIFKNLYIEDSMKIIFVPFIPTAENLAKHWYMILATKLFDRGIKIHHVKVWETPTSTAVCQEEE